MLLYRAIGDLLPEGLAEGAGVWAICQIAAPRIAPSLARAGFTGSPPDAADALFDALLASKSAVMFAVDDWEESFARVRTPNGRIQLAIPELFDELDGLASEPERDERGVPASCSRPASGARSPRTRSSATRTGGRRTATARCACIPTTRSASALRDGGRVRLSTRRGSAEVSVEISDRMQPGHISLPNGLGLDFPDANGKQRGDGRLAERADAQRGPRLDRGHAVAQAHAGARGGAVMERNGATRCGQKHIYGRFV